MTGDLIFLRWSLSYRVIPPTFRTLLPVIFNNRYDTEGRGEITLGELSRAMAEITGLTKEDITPMFLTAGRTEEVG